MTVKMILALDQDNAIGWEDGRLPWKLPEDMKRFKELTTGSTVLMGFKTFASLNRPAGLPNRHNAVLTQKTFEQAAPYFGVPQGKIDQWKTQEMINSPTCWFALPQGVHVARSFQDYVRGQQACLGCPAPDLWIIGGAEVYCQAIAHKLVDEIWLTRVHTKSGATVVVPFDLYDIEDFIDGQAQNGVQWTIDSRTVRADYDFTTLKKRT